MIFMQPFLPSGYESRIWRRYNGRHWPVCCGANNIIILMWRHGLTTSDGITPVSNGKMTGRNNDWKHLKNQDIILMPDKWEYPWYAAWDLAFHCISMAMVDPTFAKHQLLLIMREWYMKPDGQLPAYEWNFSDVNPPVQAWAAMQVYQY